MSITFKGGLSDSSLLVECVGNNARLLIGARGDSSCVSLLRGVLLNSCQRHRLIKCKVRCSSFDEEMFSISDRAAVIAASTLRPEEVERDFHFTSWESESGTVHCLRKRRGSPKACMQQGTLWAVERAIWRALGSDQCPLRRRMKPCSNPWLCRSSLMSRCWEWIRFALRFKGSGNCWSVNTPQCRMQICQCLWRREAVILPRLSFIRDVPIQFFSYILYHEYIHTCMLLILSICLQVPLFILLTIIIIISIIVIIIIGPRIKKVHCDCNSTMKLGLALSQQQGIRS